MSLFRACISKFLLGLAAIAWTACTSDNSAGADSTTAESSSSQGNSSSSGDGAGSSSKKTSFARSEFLNADSLIAASKEVNPTTDSCVTTKQYCQTLFNEVRSGGDEAADAIVTQRAKTILDSPEAKYFPESRKACLQNIKENFFFMTHSATEYGVSPCYEADDYIPGDSTYYAKSYYPHIFEKIDNAGACGDGVPNHVKVDSVYLNKEIENAERFARYFEQSLNKHLDRIEAECE